MGTIIAPESAVSRGVELSRLMTHLRSFLLRVLILGWLGCFDYRGYEGCAGMGKDVDCYSHLFEARQSTRGRAAKHTDLCE